MLFDPKMFIPFVNGENYQNFDLVSKFNFLTHIWGVIVENMLIWAIPNI